MSYQHKWLSGKTVDLPVGKVVCVGLNYANHVAEMNSQLQEQPLLFMKPATAVVDMSERFAIPEGLGDVHHELEIAILIGETLTNVNQQQVQQAIVGVGLALDLTLRDVQKQLKNQGQPWERSKAFDGSCPLSGFVSVDKIGDLQNIDIELVVNDETRQAGNSSHMLFPILPLIENISQSFTLQPGDVVLTGTPEGVSPLVSGDKVEVKMGDLIQVSSQVL